MMVVGSQEVWQLRVLKTAVPDGPRLEERFAGSCCLRLRLTRLTASIFALQSQDNDACKIARSALKIELNVYVSLAWEGAIRLL